MKENETNKEKCGGRKQNSRNTTSADVDKVEEIKKDTVDDTPERENFVKNATKDKEINNTIDDRLLQSIDVDSLMQCDKDMTDVFIKTFYSLSRDNIKIQSGNPGIVTSFLRNWTSIRGVGNLPKVLPTVLTGMPKI